jgi:hypothetical protein
MIISTLIDNSCLHSRRRLLKALNVDLDYLHLHNSRLSCDCFELSKTRGNAHPAYITDRAPSNFFLFGYLEEILWEIDIPDRKNLKTAIARIFNAILKETLVFVFPECIKQLNWMIKCKNEYYKKQKENEKDSF